MLFAYFKKHCVMIASTYVIRRKTPRRLGDKTIAQQKAKVA